MLVTNDTTEAHAELDERSLRLRRLVLRALAAADKGHVGSALSLIEILGVLFDDVARHDPARSGWAERDRVILSKGHGCLALYAVLADQGYIPPETLDTFCERHSPLGGHPERLVEFGIEASTGALGHGLPLAVGIAIALKRQHSRSRVFVVVGDGELNEGSNWEAMLIAAKHQLDTLTVIVDHNSMQQNGPIEPILPLGSLFAKLQAFGAEALEVDGHDPTALREAFTRTSPAAAAPARFRAVICRTVKGKGLAAAEHNPAWHYRRSFGDQLIEEIAREWKGRLAG